MAESISKLPTSGNREVTSTIHDGFALKPLSAAEWTPLSGKAIRRTFAKQVAERIQSSANSSTEATGTDSSSVGASQHSHGSARSETSINDGTDILPGTTNNEGIDSLSITKKSPESYTTCDKSTILTSGEDGRGDTQSTHTDDGSDTKAQNRARNREHARLSRLRKKLQLDRMRKDLTDVESRRDRLAIKLQQLANVHGQEFDLAVWRSSHGFSNPKAESSVDMSVCSSHLEASEVESHAATRPGESKKAAMSRARNRLHARKSRLRKRKILETLDHQLKGARKELEILQESAHEIAERTVSAVTAQQQIRVFQSKHEPSLMTQHVSAKTSQPISSVSRNHSNSFSASQDQMSANQSNLIPNHSTHSKMYQNSNYLLPASQSNHQNVSNTQQTLGARPYDEQQKFTQQCIESQLMHSTPGMHSTPSMHSAPADAHTRNMNSFDVDRAKAIALLGFRLETEEHNEQSKVQIEKMRSQITPVPSNFLQNQHALKELPSNTPQPTTTSTSDGAPAPTKRKRSNSDDMGVKLLCMLASGGVNTSTTQQKGINASSSKRHATEANVAANAVFDTQISKDEGKVSHGRTSSNPAETDKSTTGSRATDPSKIPCTLITDAKQVNARNLLDSMMNQRTMASHGQVNYRNQSTGSTNYVPKKYTQPPQAATMEMLWLQQKQQQYPQVPYTTAQNISNLPGQWQAWPQRMYEHTGLPQHNAGSQQQIVGFPQHNAVLSQHNVGLHNAGLQQPMPNYISQEAQYQQMHAGQYEYKNGQF